METKIAERKGYQMFYDSGQKLFSLKDAEGDVVGQGKTQDEVEQQADKLSKQKYQFPIKAFQISQLFVYPGKVTSLNLSDRSIYFVYDPSPEGDTPYRYRTRSKERLVYCNVYEATQANEDIIEQVSSRREGIKNLEGEVKDLLSRLENKMNLQYFNLKDSY